MPKLREWSPGTVDVVMYHYVRPLEHTEYPRIKGLHTDSFERQLDWLQANSRVISMAEFLMMLDEGERPAEPTTLLTFDDGLRDHVNYVLPTLQRRGLSGSFYVPSAPIVDHELLDVHRIQFILASVDTDDESVIADLLEFCRPWTEVHVSANRLEELRAEARASRFDSEGIILVKRLLQRELPREVRRQVTGELFARYVTTDEADFAQSLYLSVAELELMLDAGMHIGSHAHTHEWLTFLSKVEQEAELSRCLALLASIGAGDQWTMAYPYGHCNDTTIEVATSLSCAAAFTTQVGGTAVPASDRLRLARYDTNDFPQ